MSDKMDSILAIEGRPSNSGWLESAARAFVETMMIRISPLPTGRRLSFDTTRDWRSAAPTALARALLCGALAMAYVVGSMHTASAANHISIAAAIADFDNFDTSQEDANRTAKHEARVQTFAALLRGDLAAQKKFKIVQLTCPKPPCSAARMPPNELVRAARQAGARLLVYGGIHKESTLVQWGKIEAVDLKNDKLVLNQNFSFRGDTDQAFRRAATFIARYFETLTLSH